MEIRKSAFITPWKQSLLRKSTVHVPLHDLQDNNTVSHRGVRTFRKVAITLSASLVCCGPVQAGRVQISFLEDDAVIEETLTIFDRAGCPKESLAVFDRSVRWYNSTRIMSKLPNSSATKSGFQDFDSMTNLLGALPFRLPDAPHEFQLNCFDSVVLLAGGELKHGLAVDSAAGPFAVNCIMTNGRVSARWATTPLEAFNCSYGTWYIEKTAHLFRGELQDRRVGVVAGICGGTQLPDTTQRSGMAN